MDSFIRNLGNAKWPTWTGRFVNNTRDDLVFYFYTLQPVQEWWVCEFINSNLSYGHSVDTPFGAAPKECPSWVGDFNGDGNSEILFYYPGDGNWWIGPFNGTALSWSIACNTTGFGNISQLQFWVGNFSSSGQSEILFYQPADSHWWLGRFSGNQLSWTLAGTSGFGRAPEHCPTWSGDFTGSGRAQVLFYYPGDGNWWLGTYGDGSFAWALIGNTSGASRQSPFPSQCVDARNLVEEIESELQDLEEELSHASPGEKPMIIHQAQAKRLELTAAKNDVTKCLSQWSQPAPAPWPAFGILSDGRPIFIGDFTGSGHSQVLFYYPGDGNWWLANYQGGEFVWSLVSQTQNPAGTNFGDTSKNPTWIGDFTGSGHSQVLFYSPGDGHWWLANYQGGQFAWSPVSQTQNPGGINFGDTSKNSTWIGDFTGSGHAQVLFYSPGDGNWWLGHFNGLSLEWQLAGNTRYVPEPPPPPPPPPNIRVPNAVGLLVRDAYPLLDGVGLKRGTIFNNTGELRGDKLRVTRQDPSGGASVAQGTHYTLWVDLVQPQLGVKDLSLYNCSQDRRPINVWVYDGVAQSWTEKSQVAVQLAPSGPCPQAGATPAKISFENGRSYVIVAVDSGMINCGNNDPTNVSCQRWSMGIIGDANGQSVTFVVT